MRKSVPVVRPAVIPKSGFPVQSVGRQMFPGKEPLVAQMIQPPVVYRARPGQLEEEDDYQEEEYTEEGYCECDEEAQEEGVAETQFRAIPIFVPVGAPHRHPMTMKPKVVPVPVLPKQLWLQEEVLSLELILSNPDSQQDHLLLDQYLYFL